MDENATSPQQRKSTLNSKKGNKLIHDMIVPYNKQLMTEFEIQIAKCNKILSNRNSRKKRNKNKKKPPMHNDLISQVTSMDDETVHGTNTIHGSSGYDDYSDEEKEYSTTQIIKTMNDNEILNSRARSPVVTGVPSINTSVPPLNNQESDKKILHEFTQTSTAINKLIETEWIKQNLKCSIEISNTGDSNYNNVNLSKARLKFVDDTIDPSTLSIQWNRSYFTELIPIPRANKMEYTISVDDIGSIIKCQVRLKTQSNVDNLSRNGDSSPVTGSAHGSNANIISLLNGNAGKSVNSVNGVNHSDTTDAAWTTVLKNGPVRMNKMCRKTVQENLVRLEKKDVEFKVEPDLSEKNTATLLSNVSQTLTLHFNKDKIKLRAPKPKNFTIDKEQYNNFMKVTLSTVNPKRFSFSFSPKKKYVFLAESVLERENIAILLRCYIEKLQRNTNNVLCEFYLRLSNEKQCKEYLKRHNNQIQSDTNIINEDADTSSRDKLIKSILAPISQESSKPPVLGHKKSTQSYLTAPQSAYKPNLSLSNIHDPDLQDMRQAAIANRKINLPQQVFSEEEEEDGDDDDTTTLLSGSSNNQSLGWNSVALIINDNKNINDQDEKEINKKWSYTIRNLDANHEYLVRIRCKNGLYEGYSDWGSAIKLRTLKRKEMEQLEWCLTPYCLNEDTEFLNMNGIKIFDGISNRIQIYNKQFCKFVVNYNLSKWPYPQFIWCFELHLISNCSWLGFIENPISKTINSWNNWLGNEFYDYAIGINNKTRKCFPYAQSKSNGPIKLSKVPQKNDKIYFIIDLNQRTCQILHNNYDLGIIFRNIPTDIVPAISNGENPMDCTVSYCKPFL